mmetsp:Transcript_48780/g.87694  ORF Transcript_48780/g.87694 Transcript_48780/m.87694 type:complete len:110 (+) Transcript_48780:2038-2367(+)
MPKAMKLDSISLVAPNLQAVRWRTDGILLSFGTCIGFHSVPLRQIDCKDAPCCWRQFSLQLEEVSTTIQHRDIVSWQLHAIDAEAFRTDTSAAAFLDFPFRAEEMHLSS